MITIAVKKPDVIPRVEFQFTRQLHNNIKVIVEGKVIHHIMNIHGFYNALGYIDEIRDSGLRIDEFIKQESQKNIPDKDEICLHAKLIEYLIMYSSKFREEYGMECEGWLGRCLERDVNNSATCTNCMMYPHQHQSKLLNIQIIL